jgi:RNA polymerase sigma-70 factor (ECF subfamily)
MATQTGPRATAPARSPSGRPARLRERERTAWEQVYREYEHRLHRFAYRLTGNEHDAADLVQETFVRVLQRLDRLDRGRGDLSSYLFKTAQNLFLRGRERARRVEAVDEVPEPREPAPLEDDPQGVSLLHHQQEEVRVANGKLAPRQRLVLALCELEDKSYAEIGELVGLNENAVAQLISRARQSLRHELRLVQVDRSRLPSECQRLLPQLSGYLDGQLKGAKKDVVLLHLASCEHCQRALADMREARRRYRALIPPLAGAGALKEGIDEALAEEGIDEALAGRDRGNGPGQTAHRDALAGRPRAWLLSLAVTVTVLAGAAGTYLALGGEDAEPAALAAQTVPEIVPVNADAEEGAAPPEKTLADTAAPVVTILDGPRAKTRSHDASFRFESSEEEGEFTCSLDSGLPQECSSPALFDGLGVGPHAFTVVVGDAAGNEGAPATWEWTILPKADGPGTTDEKAGEDESPALPETEPPAPAETELQPDEVTPKDEERPDEKLNDAEPVDTTPPSIVGLSGPASPTRKTTAAFRWGTSEPVSRVDCSLDGSGFGRCYSPQGYSGLSIGQHQFCVRATDRAGNVGAASCYSWVIEEAPAPAPPPPESEPPPPPPEPTDPPPTDPPLEPPPPEPPPPEPPPSCPPTSGVPPPGC